MTIARADTNQLPEWNYSDVIALVTAYLPGNRLNGDRGMWLRGISAIAEQHPEFFRRVYFTTRQPLPPYSSQVDEVLKMLGKWEYQGSFNPRFRVIELTEEAKSELRETLEPKFAPADLQKIRQMSKDLAGYVILQEEAVKNASSSEPAHGA